MLLLIQSLGQPYVRFLEKVHAAGLDLAAMEMESLGFTHVQLTSRLLAHWGLPEALVQAVGWEESRDNSQTLPAARRALAEIVHLAELVSQLLVDGRPSVLADLLLLGRRFHDLSSAQLESLVAKLEETVGQLADVLSLQLPPGVNYQDVLIQSQTQLAELADSAAGELLLSHTRAWAPMNRSPRKFACSRRPPGS